MWPFRVNVEKLKENLAGKIARRASIFSYQSNGKYHYDQIEEVNELDEEIAVLQYKIDRLTK